MKKLISLALGATVALTAYAQYEHVHVYRSDNSFSTFNNKPVITHSKFRDGYNTMNVKSADGTTRKIAMSKIDSVVVRPYGIPEFHIDLIDHPDWEDLKKDATHTKSTVYAARLSMKGFGQYDDIEEQEVEFRGRGNSTWDMPKTPYRFKMAKKTSVCGLRKAKSFVLLANHIDCSLMRNSVAFWVANYLGLPFSNHGIPVQVYLNNNYRGSYLLTEKLGIGSGSVDIDEMTGMLFEMDSYYDEKYRFRYYWTSSDGRQMNIPVMVKDPDLDELQADDATGSFKATEVFDKWQADFKKFADAVTQRDPSESLRDVLDVEEAVDFFIVNNIAGNHELKHPKSTYIHKASLADGEVYHFGPVWDFDWAYSFDGYEGVDNARWPLVEYDGDCNGKAFFTLLFKNEEFRRIYKEHWDRFMAEGYPQLKQYIADYARLIEPSAKQNGEKWRNNTGGYSILDSWDFSARTADFKQWVDDRINYINTDPNYGLHP